MDFEADDDDDDEETEEAYWENRRANGPASTEDEDEVAGLY